MESKRRAGGCLCGAVRFEVTVEESHFNICHCGMCRRWSAGPFHAVHCPPDATFSKDQGLAWYQGSAWAERGFCRQCGTSLFWRLADTPDQELIVSVEALDDAQDLELERHIFIDSKPDRYDYRDDVPRVTQEELMKELGFSGEES